MKTKVWTKLLETYIRQKEIIAYSPIPDLDEKSDEDELPPSIKLLTHHIKPEYENQFYRWGLQGFRVGNFRIIYTIYDYYKVLLLYAFDKRYNGDITKEDIEAAEKIYEEYLEKHPSRYS